MQLVAIALPGQLLIKNIDRVIDLETTGDSSSFKSGGTASVLRGMLKDPRLVSQHGFIDVAVKIINGRSAMELESFKYEVCIMSSLPESPYIVKLVGYSMRPMSIVMKYYSMSLADMILHRKLESEEGLLKCSLETARGMEIIHSKDIIHFDLKPGMICDYL